MAKKKRKINEKHLKLFIFLLKFLAISIPYIWIKNLNFYFLQSFFAQINFFLLKIFKIESIAFDSFNGIRAIPSIYFNEMIVSIDFACTGMSSFYFLFALVFASKKPFNPKIKYLLIGALAIIAVNIIRIFASSLLFLNGILGFDNILWASSLNFAALGVFYFFMKNAK